MKERFNLSKQTIINMVNEEYFFQEMPIIDYSYLAGVKNPYTIMYQSNYVGKANYNVMYLSEKTFLGFIIGILLEKGYSKVLLSKNTDGSFKARCTIDCITRKRR